MTCGNLDWILEQKYEISGKIGNLQVKLAVQLTVMV